MREFWNLIDTEYFCTDDVKLQRQSILNKLLNERKEEASASKAQLSKDD